MSPSLVATDRLLQELDRDQGTLTDFLVNGASVVSSVAERRADLSALTQNANVALGAIANENRSFDQALVALPGALRQANTTFHNLRPALDDLDVLVNASKPATKNLPPFLRTRSRSLSRSVPVFNDLAPAVNLKGKSNDLADADRRPHCPPEARRRRDPDHGQGVAGLPAEPAVPPPIHAGSDGGGRPPQPGRGLLRRRRPLPAGAPVGIGVFSPTPAGCKTAPGSTCTFAPQNASTVFSDYGALGGPNYNLFKRCPGGSASPIGGSNPFYLAGLPRSTQRRPGEPDLL